MRQLSLNLIGLCEVEAPPLYPETAAGWKGAHGGASHQAAQVVTKELKGRRKLVLDYFSDLGRNTMGKTADEAAADLGLHPKTVAPRMSELAKLGLLEQSPIDGKSSLGATAHRWRIARGGANG